MPSTTRPTQDTRATSLVGRHDEMETALEALRSDSVRLLTITGVAGVGKTRFATALAERLAPHYPDGHYIVDLTAIDDPGDLDVELGRELGLRARDRAAIPAGVDAWLAAHDALLLLDNAEHVLGIAGRVMEWLARSPRSRVIVTSRHRLNVSVETELFLDTLPVARRPEVASPETLSPAARLFLDIAGADPAALDPETVAAAERVCAGLEGLPLAIELVAAQVTELTREALNRISVGPVASGAPAPSEVEATLNDAVDWSYRLLSAPSQQLLRYLTVFVDGFNLELTEYLARRAEHLDDRLPVADCLDELASHHLILPAEEPVDGGPVFRMPAIVTASARGRLIDAGELDDASRAQALAVTDFATAREFSGLRPGHEHEIAELDAHIHCVTVALEWFRDHEDAEGLLTLVSRLFWFWYAHGFYADGLAWFEEVVRLDPPRDHPLREQFLTAYGTLLDLQHDFTRARALLDEAWEVHQRNDSVFGMAATSVSQGIVAFHQKRHEDADRWLHRAIDLAMRMQDRSVARALEGIAWENLGANAHDRGMLDDAERALRQAIAIHERSGYRWGSARALCDLGNLLRDRHDLPGALAASQAGIAAARPLGDHRLLAAGLAGIATVLTEDNQPRLAAWLWGAVDALLPAAGDPSLLGVNTEAYTRSRLIARRRLGVAGYAATIRQGVAAPLDDALDRAMAARLQHRHALHIPTEVNVALTNRERDVLDLVVEGASTEAIAETLGISERTVSSHIGSLLRKFNVNSRLELISAATRNA